MKSLHKENEKISTILAFALIPLSGLALDIYIPSFPQMTGSLHTSAAAIKFTLTIYLLSYGISQLFVGSILDSFGRYKIELVSLLIFTLSCIGIAMSDNVGMVYFLRFIQGITISFIVVCKRAFIIDVYEGEKRKKYTSLITVVWSSAPIVAPFLGGYLESSFGWRSNFYFLASYAVIILFLELIYSGETLKIKQKFNIKDILGSYKTLLSAHEFSIGIIILGLGYGAIMAFGMSIAFIVENKFQLSSVTSGYCSLASGVAIFLGGLASKWMIDKPFFKKLHIANFSQLAIALIMLLTASIFHELLPIVVFVMLLHFWQGFVFNAYMTYALTKFPQYAATASGLTSGGAYIFASFASYLVTSLLVIDGQKMLSIQYIILFAAIAVLFIFVHRLTKIKESKKNLA